MVLEEKFTEVRSLDELRKMIRDAEKRHNVKVHYLVGTKEDVTEEEAYLAIPLFEPELRNRNMKYAAVGAIIPGIFKTQMINILFAEYLDEDNALMNFLIKQKKYSLTKVFIME